ncbi:MAG: hypothetical protein AAGF83_17005 [Cyanobacteria bacterium P01_G01_bin.67]
MNPLFAKLLRSIYLKEPISGFILLVGVTDALIGGLGGQGSLLSIGLFIALLGVIMRWRQGAKKPQAIATEPTKYYLPPGKSRQPLPLLTSREHRKY